jgi:hypothetical protein
LSQNAYKETELVAELAAVFKLAFVICVFPSLIKPFEFTEKWVYLLPITQKSKPIGAKVEINSPSGEAGTSKSVALADISVKDSVLELVKL